MADLFTYSEVSGDQRVYSEVSGDQREYDPYDPNANPDADTDSDSDWPENKGLLSTFSLK